jgi:hypothetical protein
MDDQNTPVTPADDTQDDTAVDETTAPAEDVTPEAEPAEGNTDETSDDEDVATEEAAA